MHLVIPKSFNDAQDVADKFKDAIPVIINLQGSETDLSKRLIDFASGLTYALDGGHAADRRQGVPAHAAQRGAELRGARAVDREGLLQPVVDSPGRADRPRRIRQHGARARPRVGRAGAVHGLGLGPGAGAGGARRRPGRRLQPRAGRARRHGRARAQAGAARRRGARDRGHREGGRVDPRPHDAGRAPRRLPRDARLPDRAEHARRGAPRRARVRRARRAGARGLPGAGARAVRPPRARSSTSPRG